MSDQSNYDQLGAALRDNPSIAVIFANANGDICFWNAGAEAIFGYPAAETAGHRIDLVVPPEYRDMHWAGFHRAIGSEWRGSDGWGPIDGRHKSGELVPLEVLLTPVNGPDGRVAAVMGMFRRRPA